MRKLVVLAAVCAMGLWLAPVVNAGCGACGGGADHAHDAAEKATCGKCGEVKGSDTCCAEDAKKCDACGLNAGSPGCKAKCSVEKTEE